MTYLFLQNDYGDTPLNGACRNGHLSTALVLLEHGATVDSQDKVNFFTVACMKEQCSAAAGDSVIMLDGLLL